MSNVGNLTESFIHNPFLLGKPRYRLLIGSGVICFDRSSLSLKVIYATPGLSLHLLSAQRTVVLINLNKWVRDEYSPFQDRFLTGSRDPLEASVGADKLFILLFLFRTLVSIRFYNTKYPIAERFYAKLKWMSFTSESLKDCSNMIKVSHDGQGSETHHNSILRLPLFIFVGDDISARGSGRPAE